jgi:hypothetical protein
MTWNLKTSSAQTLSDFVHHCFPGLEHQGLLRRTRRGGGATLLPPTSILSCVKIPGSLVEIQPFDLVSKTTTSP